MRRILVSVLTLMISGRASAADQADVGAKPAARRAVRKMLEIGFTRGRSNLDAADSFFQTAQRTSDHDPRIHYCYGLVLLKQLRSSDALRQFKLACDEPAETYAPSLQATSWLLLRTRKHADALDHLSSLARVIERVEAVGLDEQKATETAEWIGRCAGSLELLLKSNKDKQLLERQEHQIRKALSTEHLKAYDQGKSKVRDQFRQLAEQRNFAAQQTTESQLKVQQQRKVESDQEQNTLDGKRVQLKTTAEQWKKWLDEQLSASDAQLATLEKSRRYLESRRQSLSRSMLSLRQEITLRSVRQRPSRVSQKRLPRAGVDALERENQMTAYKNEYQRTSSQISAVQMNTFAVFQKRRAIINRYQQATGRLAKQDKVIDSRSRRLDIKNQKLGKVDNGKSARTRSLARRSQSIGTYVPFDIEAEKERLLKEFSAP